MPRPPVHPSLLVGTAAICAIWAGGRLGLGAWSTHWTIPAGIVALQVLYASAAGPWRERGGWGPPIPTHQWLCFTSACAILFFALTGPMHDISDSYLFTGHMLQHLLITLLVPPMLLIGTPAWMARRALAVRPVGAVVRAIGQPVPAFLIFTGTMALWHLPVLYNSTLIRLDVHVAEHLLFIAAAVIGWWPVLAPAPEERAGIAFQLIYLLLLPFPLKLVGLLITMSDQVLYPAYAIAPRIWDISALGDQQIGGIIMWVPAGFVFWITLAAHFFRWYREAHAQDVGARNVVPLSRERVL